MNIRALKTLVKQGETDTIEFKLSTGQLARATETLCAFLNKKGGMVLLGISDSGEILGEKVNDATKRDIANQLNRIEPLPDIETIFIPLTNNTDVIVLIAKPSSNGPYVCNGRPYVRIQSTTKVMPQEEYKRILYSRLPTTAWEDQLSNHCTIDDLDKDLIKNIVRTAISEKRLHESDSRISIDIILKKFNLIIGDKLTNGAVILFCKNEHLQFPQSLLKLARFRGNEKDEFIDQKMIRNRNTFEVYEEAMAFLSTYIPVAGKIEEENAFRVDTPAILSKSLREALINAIVHRDYSVNSGSISIGIYDNRIEITSIGPLPHGITLQQLSKRHDSFPRNPHMASIFHRCGMIEQWGRGTYDMIKLCKERGYPKPKFKETIGSFSVILPFKEPIQRVEIPMPEDKIFLSLTDRQKSIIKTLKSGPLSRQEIMNELQHSYSVRIVQIDLLKLCNLDIIIKSGKTAGRFVKWSLKR
ncbi:putative DNA binding domain-containing protein [Candidatus Dependentiae bacterium]|nr:putative DNA binding domain-containing protein [Candidatus Dependentiae bacterium]